MNTGIDNKINYILIGIAMAQLLNILTWNERGIMSSAYCVSKLLDLTDCDFALLCEHKLLPHSLHFMDTINQIYIGYTTNDFTLDGLTTYSRGKGGVSILYKKELRSYTHRLDIRHDKIIGVQVHTIVARPLFVFCAYLPPENDVSAYRAVLQDIHDLYTYYKQYGNVLIGGDFNASCKQEPRTNANKSIELRNFLNEHCLIPLNINDKCKGATYTYSPMQTSLDYIITDEVIERNVQDCEVLSDDAIDNVSDHLPIIASISMVKTLHKVTVKLDNISTAWHKATPDQFIAYQLDMESELRILNTVDYKTNAEINYLTNAISEQMLNSSAKHIPQSKYNKHTKPYWDDQIKLLHSDMRQARIHWLTAGRPRDKANETYQSYKLAKRNFRAAQRKANDNYLNQTYRDLDEAADLDIRLFWRLVRRQTRKPNSSCQQLIFNGRTHYDEISIANGFAEFYKCIYAESTCDEYDPEFKSSCEEQLKTLIKQSYNESDNCHLESLVTVEEVGKLVKNLKKRKAPGCDRITNEHIIYGGPTVLEAITKLFNCILKAEYIPEQWRQGLIVPIYKGKNKSMSDPGSYRPVSLLSAVYKLFEKLLNTRINTYLRTNTKHFPNPQQHGFHPNHSCITAAFVLQETILHNLSLGSNVYTAFLDTKQAFDCVWHTGLFIKLNQLGIKGKIWRLIINSYQNLKSAVYVNSHQSDWFPVHQGVRQGGVQSGFYYLVYIDELLDLLQNSQFGAKNFSYRMRLCIVCRRHNLYRNHSCKLAKTTSNRTTI